MTRPAFGSLFSGIGGIDLGLERAGWRCRWQVENDPFCQSVLRKHWPDVSLYGDVKELDPHDLEPVDLIAGGFPCPPVSQAGRGLGRADERWLWPEFARILRVLRPRLALVENVPGLLTCERGEPMGEVLGDLATLGYDTVWDCIPAAALGAPHLRWRVFIVAAQGRVPNAFGGELWVERQRLGQQRGEQGETLPGLDGEDWPVADPDGNERGRRSDEASALPGSEGQGFEGFPIVEPEDCGGDVADASGGQGIERPDPDLLGGRSDEAEQAGLGGGGARSGWWASEPDVGRVADGVPSDVDKARLRALGNAVVPQVAEWIGRRILEAS